MNTAILFVKKAFHRAAQILFPPTCPYCGEVVELDRTVCDSCAISASASTLTGSNRWLYPFSTRKTKYISGIVAPFVYEETVAQGIVGLKSDPRFCHAVFFAPYMSKALLESGFAETIDAVTFVPPHFTKRDRALPQRLAELVSVEIGKPLLPLLKKVRATKSQHNLTLAQRKTNLDKAFHMKNNHSSVKGKTVLLCDDVTTSGTTLDTCARVLVEEGGARAVYAAVIACTRGKKRNR